MNLSGSVGDFLISIKIVKLMMNNKWLLICQNIFLLLINFLNIQSYGMYFVVDNGVEEE